MELAGKDNMNSFEGPPISAVVEYSSIGDLEKLADLRDTGIITPAEFEAKKKQILGI